MHCLLLLILVSELFASSAAADNDADTIANRHLLRRDLKRNIEMTCVEAMTTINAATGLPYLTQEGANTGTNAGANHPSIPLVSVQRVSKILG